MQQRELTCIGCPMGCMLKVTMDQGQVTEVTGNTCKRGEVYAKKEVTNPTRIVTSSVRVKNGTLSVVSVKTKEDIPKEKIKDCMKALQQIEVQAPIHIGTVILENAAQTGVDIIATKEIPACSDNG